MATDEPSLSDVRRKLNRWRKSRSGPKANIPKEIWREAAELARLHETKEVAFELQLEPRRLQMRVDRLKRKPGRPRKPIPLAKKMARTPKIVEVASINIPASELPMSNLKASKNPNAVLTMAGGASLALYGQLGAKELQALITAAGGLQCSS